jgi:anti-sigma factor RsiW
MEHDMTCQEASQSIARFADADETLDAVTRAAIESHVETCAMCRAVLETQRTVAAVLRTRPHDAVSPEFTARLAARLDAVSGWLGIADWRVWTLRLAPLAAVLALALFLGSGSSTQPTVTLEEWTVGGTDAASSVSLLWRSDVNSEALMETMLTGEMTTASGDSGNVR